MEESVDLARIEKAVREILVAVGEDPDRDGLQQTPARVARAYAELFAGLRVDPAQVLSTTFEANHEELVLVRDIDVMSLCEHHLLPFRAARTSATSPGRTAASPACPSWPGWSRCSPGARRCRSG